jgi:hypothetical protein
MSSVLIEKLAGNWVVPPYMITNPRLWDAIPKRDGVSMVTLIDAGVRNVTPGQRSESPLLRLCQPRTSGRRSNPTLG